MDAESQKAGEKRVRDLLIEPLLRCGLGKPGTLTKAAFVAMQDELCAKLAYMSEVNLAGLAEHMQHMPGGKARDRFPLATVILEEARKYQAPDDSGSPLLRAVFAHQLGATALADGWAPELLAHLRQHRVWPGAYAIKTVRDSAVEAVRRMRMIDEMIARGDVPTPDEAAWRNRRLAAMQRCRDLAALGREDAA